MTRQASQPILINVAISRRNGGGTPEEQSWNARLAPIARQLHPDHVPNWLRWCKRMMDAGVSVDDLEEQMGGFVYLRDRGFLKWVERGEPVKPGAIERLPTGERDQLAKAYRHD